MTAHIFTLFVLFIFYVQLRCFCIVFLFDGLFIDVCRKLAQRHLVLDKAEEYLVSFVPSPCDPDTYTCAQFWNARLNNPLDQYQYQFIDHAKLVIHEDGVWQMLLYEAPGKALKVQYGNEGYKGIGFGDFHFNYLLVSLLVFFFFFFFECESICSFFFRSTSNFVCGERALLGL
jgi:hypothetical protein